MAAASPASWQSVEDAQAFLAEKIGGEPFEYGRDQPATLEAAQSLGVAGDFERVAALSRAQPQLNGDILALGDDAFVAAWADMDIEVRSALPADVQDRARARYGKIMGRPKLAHLIAAPLPEKARKAAGVAPLPGFPASAIWGGYEAPPYLVKQVLGPSEVTVLFGASGHFKSVIAVDLALSIGTGTEFHGIRTRKAGVLYVAGEGHVGIRKRLRAWMMDKDMDAGSEQPSVYVTSVAANLMGAPEVLRVTAEAAAQALACPIELVIIDTLAANFGPGDENHASEMQLAIHAARAAAPAAGVLLVHHIGHGQDERERGSYALIAAADYRLKASYDDFSKVIELSWLKVKDDERPKTIGFAWKAVPIEWLDTDGEELSSVVLERLSEGASTARNSDKSAGLGGNQELALRVLRGLILKARKNLIERGDDPSDVHLMASGWRKALESKGIDRRRFPEVQAALIERGLIRIEGPSVFLSED